jgi:AcrR family transcriptional regulator
MPNHAEWRAELGSEYHEQFRYAIVLAAEKLIDEVGIAGLGIGALPERLDCTRQNLYRYFASKRRCDQKG